MVERTLYVVDSEALRVTFSTTQPAGATVINNSDSPNGTRYVFNSGYPSRAVTINDTGGSSNTLEDDRSSTHVVTNGAGLVNNGNGIEAESLIQVQLLDANGSLTGPVITITVLSQNGVTSDVWGFVSDAPLVSGASYQKIGGNNIGTADYATYGTPWLSGVDGTNSADTMGPGYTDAQGDQIDGTDGNDDLIFGYGGRDSISGGLGNDTIIGGPGQDTLNGGAGIDTADYSTSTSAVTVNLATGTGSGGDAQGDVLSNFENLTGSNYNDSLTGDANANVLIGNPGNDTLRGGAGGDTLIGGPGADLLDGGTGIDTADYTTSGAGVTVNLATGTGSGGDAQGDTLIAIENITGSFSNDNLTGDGNANVLIGGGGNDTLSGGAGADNLNGGAGADSLLGGDGDDTVIGGAGADALDGGSGTDTADYSTSTAGVSVNLATGIGIGGDAQGDTLVSIENLTGSTLSDSLTGDGNANILSGGAGNDTLAGGGGNDTLVGGAGNDTLIGGAGNDVLSGGAGDDRFSLGDGFGADKVTDFDTGDADNDGFFNDQLDLSGLTDADGNPVNVWDIVVSDDGFGRALLTFPNGETLLLQGVSPSRLDSPAQLARAGVPCYAPGTLIDTPEGPRAVETLIPGDLVMTRDRGAQAIRWIRSADQPLDSLGDDAKPVQIRAGALGRDLPARDLIVSPQHRILVGGHGQLQNVFASEKLAPAKSLTALPGIRHMKNKSKITWVQFAFDHHEVVTANGCQSESLLLGPMVVQGLQESEFRVLRDIFGPPHTPDTALNGPPARECLTVGASQRQIAKFLRQKRKVAPMKMPKLVTRQQNVVCVSHLDRRKPGSEAVSA